MSSETDIVCQRTGENSVVFAVKQNGNLLELRVGRVNGDYIHKLMVDREEKFKLSKDAPFWDESFVMDELSSDLLEKMAQQAMAEGVLERICRTCRAPLEVNGKPLYVRCETCGWFYCPDCHAHYVRPTRCWRCWKKEVDTHVERKKFRGSEYDAVDMERLAELFLEWSAMWRFSDTGDTFIFDFYDLKWRAKGEVQLEKFFYRTLKSRFLKNKVRQYLTGYILTEVTVDRDKVPRLPLNLVPAADCFVDWATDEKVDIDPSQYFYLDRHTPPFRKGATCEMFDRFVKEITSTDDEADTLVELMGFCLWRSYAINAIFIFVGEGANGKTTFVELLNDMIGPSLCSAEDIFNLTKIRFASASLWEKNANLCADLPEGTIFNSAILKKLSGNDTFQAEKKNKDSFPFVNFAKLVFSCNIFPTFIDTSYGFWRRMKVIEFPHRFPIDPEFPILLRKEMPGIFNRALEGLRRLMDRYEFSLRATPESARAEYMGEGNSSFTFIKSYLEVGAPRDALECSLVHLYYKRWCTDNHLKDVVSEKKLWGEINKRFPTVTRKRKKDHSVLDDGTKARPYHYCGLRWSQEWDG